MRLGSYFSQPAAVPLGALLLAQALPLTYFEAWLSVLLPSSLFPSGCRRCSMPVFTQLFCYCCCGSLEALPPALCYSKVMQDIWLLHSAFQTLRDFAESTYCFTQVVNKVHLGTVVEDWGPQSRSLRKGEPLVERCSWSQREGWILWWWSQQAQSGLLQAPHLYVSGGI